MRPDRNGEKQKNPYVYMAGTHTTLFKPFISVTLYLLSHDIKRTLLLSWIDDHRLPQAIPLKTWIQAEYRLIPGSSRSSATYLLCSTRLFAEPASAGIQF